MIFYKDTDSFLKRVTYPLFHTEKFTDASKKINYNTQSSYMPFIQTYKLDFLKFL